MGGWVQKRLQSAVCFAKIIKACPRNPTCRCQHHEVLLMRRLRWSLLVLVPVLLARPAFPGNDKKQPKIPDKVSYYKDVRPIFQQHCQGCHQPAKAEGSYVMTSHAELLKMGDKDKPGVVPSKPGESYLLAQIVSKDGKPPAMPRGKDALAAHQVTLITKWIEQGAIDDTPAAAKQVVDADNPPTYELAPVITALAYSPDSELLAVSGYHEVLLHKADGTARVGRLIGLSERVQSLSFSPDGKWLAVCGGAPGRFGEVQIWDVQKKKLKLSLPVTYDTVYGVRWSPDGTKISFGCADNSLRAIEASTGKQILYQGGHSDWVFETVFSKDASHLISVSRDMSMKLTEVSTERLVDNITSITPGALKGGLITVDRHPTKDEVVIGGADGTPKLYQIYRTKPRKIGDDFNLIRPYGAMPGRIFSARFNADGSRFVVGSSKDGTGEARIYKTDDAKLIAKLEGGRGPVYAVAYRPDGAQVASAGFDGTVRLNDAKTGKLIREFVPCPLKTATR
jgi:mono/diheme cytochrome c family protein